MKRKTKYHISAVIFGISLALTIGSTKGDDAPEWFFWVPMVISLVVMLRYDDWKKNP